MLVKVKSEKEYITAAEFICNNDAEKWFEKYYGYTIQEWEEDTPVCDTDIIEAYLHKQKGLYFIVYNEQNTGSMIVYEFKDERNSWCKDSD